MLEDSDRLWQAIESGDPRFDGWFFTAVRTTGIYCRPSCPARTPKRENVRFFARICVTSGRRCNIAMRALRDPDAFLPGDLGVRHALRQLGHESRFAGAAGIAERWRPYRAYALVHLWASLAAPGEHA